MAVTEQALYERMRSSPLQEQDGYHLMPFDAMGTANRLMFSAASPARAELFRTEALRWLARFEMRYSTFIADSLISRINREAALDWVPIDPETAQLFALCDWFHWKTQGVLDPTVRPLLELWDYHVPHTALPHPAALEAARQRVGWKRVERREDAVRFPQEGMQLDLGGIGKEFAVDRVMKLADQHNITNILVDLGHDIRVSGSPPEGGAWRIGLEHPRAPGRSWGGVTIADEAMCGSGNYLRYFELGGQQYGHIIDPRSGRPTNNGCRVAWVLAPTAVEAGALATAALILGVDEGMRLIDQTYQAAGCIWCEDQLYQTRRFARHVLQDEAVRVS
ncbi:MAG: FAD:protein FMN transferase [Lentisphaerae bacterium]|nr:FAD:protein FMN transferase [Lentisphaerota bacterium]